jgi:putative ABC transport system permease protein
MLRDLRYAVRQLRHSPVFAIAVLLTLAVAIGANTAMFSVIRAVLLQPLPYKDPGRLLCLWHSDAPDYTWYTFSHPRFLYFHEQLRDLAETAAYDDEIVTLTYRGTPVRLEGGRVSANFFSLLGVKPAIGRTFLPNEDRHGATPVALLSDRIWRERYGADRNVVGRTIAIDSEEFTVIGVMPRDFQFLGVPVDVWRSRIVDTRTFAPASVQLGASYLTVIARLNPGVRLAQVQAKLNVIANQYTHDNPGNSDITGSVHAASLQEKIFAGVHLTLLLLWAAVGCLLIIACANVANLVLARSTARYREISVRFALGASQFHIARQLIVENVFLALCSIVVSLPLSLWGMQSLLSILRRTSASIPDVHLDFGVMLFTFGIAAAIGTVVGLMPLWLLRRGDSQAGVRSQERGFSSSKWSTQFRNSIVAVQIALCVVLLSAAGLLIESFVRMSGMNTGVHTDHVLLFPLDLMPDKYTSWQQRINFYDDVLRRVQTIPGLNGAAIASRVDLVGSGLGYLVQAEGQPDLGSRNPGARGRSVTPDYFRILGIPLLSGRLFDARDTAQSARVAIINEAFAKKFFPGVNPIGKHVTYSTDRIYCQIVGVIGNIRVSVQSTQVDQQIYLPLSQRPWLVAMLLTRATNLARMPAAIRERVRMADPDQAVGMITPMNQVIANRLGRPRSTTSLVAIFAFSALFLATVGIYGVIAYSVAQRRKEIGIRIALGADAYSVRSLIFRQTFSILAIGLLVGLPAAAMFGRFYSSLLFEVQPGDPIALAVTGAVLAAVAFAASYVPAVRATKVDPIAALRTD